MSLAVGDRVRVRLNGSCSTDFGNVVVAGPRDVHKHELARTQHRQEAEGHLGRIIRIVPGSDHPFAVLYIDRMGREDPLRLPLRNGVHLVMGGDYAAGELGEP